jgi:hypothetical protein
MTNPFELSRSRGGFGLRVSCSRNSVVSRRITTAGNFALIALNNAVGQWIYRSSRCVLAGQRRHPDQSAISGEEFNDHVD